MSIQQYFYSRTIGFRAVDRKIKRRVQHGKPLVDILQPDAVALWHEDNIRYAQEYGACDTVIPASDTIVESVSHEVISNIPDRSVMYQGQTPQSFKAKKLKELYEGLTEEEKEILTDACKIFVIKGQDVHLVEGEVFNIKITYPYDLRVAETLIKGEDK